MGFVKWTREKLQDRLDNRSEWEKATADRQAREAANDKKEHKSDRIKD